MGTIRLAGAVALALAVVPRGAAALPTANPDPATMFSLFHGAVEAPEGIGVYIGLDGTGNALASLSSPNTLQETIFGCSDTLGLSFCPDAPIGVAIPGITAAIRSNGHENDGNTGSITVAHDVLDTVVPEPVAMALVATGLVVLAGASLLRRRSS